MSEDLLTTAEVAAIARMTPESVRAAIARGELEATRPGRILLVPREALRAWLEASRVAPTGGRSATRVSSSSSRSSLSRAPRRSSVRDVLREERARRAS